MTPFGPWLPDQPIILNGHLRDAQNVTPKQSSYGPFKALTSGTEALGSRPYGGAGSFRDASGATHVFVGTEQDLFELQDDGSWGDVSRVSGGAYTTGLTSFWRFVQFGDLCIATNWNDAPQVFTMSSDTNFAALGGSPPQARHIHTFRDFVVLGHTDNSAFEIAWSGINDAESWTAGTDQSDTQILPDGGIVQGFAGSDVLYIFQQARIRRMQYVGPPLIMQIDPITDSLGCAEPGSIAQFAGGAAFLSNDGFYMLQQDTLTPIGADMVDEWFRDDFNESYKYRMTAAADTKAKLIYWSYPSTQSVTGTPDTILMYNWTAKRWAYARQDNEGISRVYALGYTLDGLDALTTNIDNFDVPLDDQSLTGGNLQVNGFGSTYQLGPFSGDALEATIVTGDFEVHTSKRTFVSGVEPFVDTTEVTVATSARERMGDSIVYDSAEPIEVTGIASAESNGRFHRFRCVVASGATWDDATGIDIEAQLEGEA